jgi:DNA-binding response OmpR family regulator
MRVVAVSRDPERTALLDTLLVDANDYDVIVLESLTHGYSRIKQVAPDLVVVFMEADDVDACQLLSMLRVDSDLSGIHIVTHERHDGEGDFDLVTDTSRHSSRQMVGIHMN